MKQAVKTVANIFFILLLLPCALLAAFGRLRVTFDLFAHLCAGCPGIIGEYSRRAYYWMTLRNCSLDTCFSYGTFFSHRDAVVEPGVYIGAYCVIGRTHIGARTQIACNVHVLSGAHQHRRTEDGRIGGAESGSFEAVCIGSDCWIGTSVIVMANVGERTTIGAGSVVTKPIPARSVAVGIPATVIKSVD
jgi:virginiamycin A acetyltransferase